jgi:CRP-like cAMP-binding protein
MSMQPVFHDVPPMRSQHRAARSVPPAHVMAGPIEMMGAPMVFPRNGEIYGEGEPADYIYKLISGTVRTSKVLSDGRRQIGAFYLPGEAFGLEPGDEHAFSAEAIAPPRSW